jgi:hypothetical protein
VANLYFCDRKFLKLRVYTRSRQIVFLVISSFVSLFLDSRSFLCYIYLMSIMQTVEIPANRRLTIDVPREVPVGPTILTFRPATAKKTDKAEQKHGTPVTERSAGSLTPHTDALIKIFSNMGEINIDEIREERLAKHLK